MHPPLHQWQSDQGRPDFLAGRFTAERPSPMQNLLLQLLPFIMSVAEQWLGPKLLDWLKKLITGAAESVGSGPQVVGAAPDALKTKVLGLLRQQIGKLPSVLIRTQLILVLNVVGAKLIDLAWDQAFPPSEGVFAAGITDPECVETLKCVKECDDELPECPDCKHEKNQNLQPLKA